MTTELVAMTEAHLADVLIWRNEPNVRRNMYSQHEITTSEHAAWWNANKDRTDRRYFVFLNDGVGVGFVSITDIDMHHGTAYWAFFSAPDAPKGTGRRMETAALDHAFDVLGIRKLCCEVLDFNQRVIDLHQSFGFEIEGRLRAQKLIDGAPCDVVQLAIFSIAWENKKKKVI